MSITRSVPPSLSVCPCCLEHAVEQRLDLGDQPASNRFPSDPHARSVTHPLRLGSCLHCGLIQLIEPIPEALVRTPHDWIVYNEPEGHLDQLVDALLPVTDATSRILGLTYKDRTTLARLARRGRPQIAEVHPDRDLEIDDPCAGLETIQARLTPERVQTYTRTHGLADMLLVRHILEHAHAPHRFLQALKELGHTGSLFVFEVPDARKFLAMQDHTFIWEEHISYFTPDTLRTLLQSNGFDIVSTRIAPYPLEDSLIMVAQRTDQVMTNEKTALSKDTEHALMRFADAFGRTGQRLRQVLESVRKEGKQVILFGAGHLSAKFINFYGLKDLIHCVIDDNANKQGRFLPGSGCPIVPSSHINDPNIGLCLLALSPESEARVMPKLEPVLRHGGRIASIFRGSTIAVLPPESVATP